MQRSLLQSLRLAPWQLFVLLGALLLSGCNGCRPGSLVNRDDKKAPDIDELEKKKQEKPKEDFEFQPVEVIPGDPDDSRSFVKPGHWVATRHLIKANNFDFLAELHTRTTDSTGEPLEVENTPFAISSSRPAALPKGQDKAFESTYFIPVINQTDGLTLKTVWLHRDLRAARGGRLMKEDVRQGTVAMPLYQYHFMVLSSEPSRYGYLKALTCFTAPTATEVDTDKVTYYRVHAPKIDRFAPLPNQVSTWTSIAYLLWDDISPGVLTLPQQQALIDWLHFGGQLVISGPNTLEKLRGSFLDPYLPAAPGQTEEVPQSAIDELNEYWSLREKKTGVLRDLSVLPGKPVLAVQLTAEGDATVVPHTANLVLERRVGSGRIVVTAFALHDTRILNWGSIDSFFNAAILRRPRRRFETRDFIPDTVFADFHPALAKDSRLSSTLRFFTRDIGIFSDLDRAGQLRDAEPEYPPGMEPFPTTVSSGLPMTGPRATAMRGPNSPSALTSRDLHPEVDDWHFRGFWSGWRTSMAAWNDRSGASNAARQSLKDAAGISIPKGEFVLKVLAIYLAVLAPLNWLVFRLLGRVEWAWVSAPVIAIIGAFAVVRLAQLDIGFARSVTEIAVVETFGDFPRAHATRYAALYTSLSTSYDMDFVDDGALALPFAASQYSRGLHDALYTVTMRRDKQLGLAGFFVSSNQTGTMHCEQMVDLGGVFALRRADSGGWILQNGSRFPLRDAGVLRRTSAGQLETAWIGELHPRSAVPLQFSSAPDQKPHFPQWDESPETLSYEVQIQELLRRLDSDQDGNISRREARHDPDISAEFTRIDQMDARGGDNLWGREEMARWCRTSRAGEVSLGQLWELASKGLRLLPGEMRLLAWTAAEVPGITVRPAASQDMRRAMFLVHLAPGSLPEPQPDVNLLVDVAEIKPEVTEPEPADVPPSQSPPSPGPTGNP